MIYLVSRHQGAVAWSQQQGIVVDVIVSHIDISVIKPGDTVIGTLPINLAAEIQRLGGRYIHLSLEVPFEWRGVELTSDQLNEVGASLQEFRIEKME